MWRLQHQEELVSHTCYSHTLTTVYNNNTDVIIAFLFSAVSLVAFTVMAVLAILEFFVYRDTWMKYEYEVDKDFSSKLRINIDITVAMRCQQVGADILDLAETMITSNELQYEPVVFDLSPQQRLWQRALLHVQSRLREEHALQEVLYKTLMKGAPTALPPREDAATEPHNACRIHGYVYVNKVAGNFHITDTQGGSVKYTI
uniref:Endoplasmic reticulum-Golgi intermediate compartment protein n=1 Tax=Periophthalmus magnuspinnatus TaxID=409849 RepID=A0A3B3ZD98_9GOBI